MTITLILVTSSFDPCPAYSHLVINPFSFRYILSCEGCFTSQVWTKQAMEKKAGGKRKRSGESSGSMTSKRGNTGQRATVQQLWSRLHYDLLLECFKTLDIRNTRRLSRVSRDWESSLWNLPVYNKGVLFLSWYKNGGEKLVKGRCLSLTDVLWNKDADPKYNYVSMAVIRPAPMDHYSLSVLFGADLQYIRYVICDGRGFRHNDPMLKFLSRSEDSLLKKEPNHQISRITLYKKNFDESFYFVSTVLRCAAAFDRIPNIDFVGSSFSFDVGLDWIWDYGIPTYYVECFLPKISIEFPIDRSGLVWEDPESEDTRGDPSWFIGWYHRWIYEGLRDNNALWNYPAKQIKWFRACLDMVPACEDTAAVGGGGRLKLDLENSAEWTKEKKLDGIIPKTDLYFDGYQLDKLECEILAQWFQLANNRIIKKQLAKVDNSDFLHPEFPKYPKPPCRLSGIAALKPRAEW